MDVELQILKHLARDAHPTVAIAKRCCEAQIVDEYCAEYKDLFKEVIMGSGYQQDKALGQISGVNLREHCKESGLIFRKQ